MKKSVNLFICALSLSAFALSGCGIKPGNVTAPQGEEKDTFPGTYPSPSTFSRPDTQN